MLEARALCDYTALGVLLKPLFLLAHKRRCTDLIELSHVHLNVITYRNWFAKLYLAQIF